MAPNIYAVIIGLLAVLQFTRGHPGEDHDHLKWEAQQLGVYSKRSLESVKRCSNTEASHSLRARALSRRMAGANKLVIERGINSPLAGRDLASLQSFEAIDHNQTGTVNTDNPSSLFSSNTSCILSPEVTIGPYYVLGEYVRSNVTESQAGVPMHLEIQFVDVSNCSPVENLLIDIWNCNSTGTYSGVTGEGGLNTTFLRGVQQTSSDGVVEFDTLFPGHYQGRATHTHMAVHTNATLLPNGSYTGGSFSHVGQLFFDEALIAAVEGTSPYTTNTAQRTKNDEDSIAQMQADNNADPLVQYIYLNPFNVADGILAWIEIGIDPTANHTSSASWAAVLAADGGHANGNVRGGGPPGSGTGMPGGPAGTATSSGASGTGTAVVSVSTSGANSLQRRYISAGRRWFGRNRRV